MKIIGILLIFSFLLTVVNAQIKLEIGTQINGPMDEDFSTGAGIFADAKYMVNNSIGIGLSVGYQHLFMASGWETRWYEEWGYRYSDANYNILPIRATCNYYFGKKLFKPYLGIETGVTKFYEEYTYYDSSYGDLTNESDDTKFAFAPQAGFEYGLGKTISLDFNIKYNGFDMNYISTKFGVVINL
jgi:opacity protein-like surface antigen